MHMANFLTGKHPIKVKPGSQASHAKERNVALMPIFFFSLTYKKPLLLEPSFWRWFFHKHFFFFWLPSDWSQALVCLPPIAFKLIIFNIFGTADYTQTWPVSVHASHMLWNNHWLGQFKSNFLHSWSQFSTSDYSQHDLNYIIKAHIQINFSKHEQLGLKHSGSHKIWYAGIFSRLSKLGYSKILWNDFKTAHKTLIFWFAVNRVTLVSPINTCICLFFSVLQKQINLI